MIESLNFKNKKILIFFIVLEKTYVDKWGLFILRTCQVQKHRQPGVFTVRFDPVLTQKYNQTGKWYSLLIQPGPNREPVQTEPVMFGSGQFFSQKNQGNRIVLW